MPTIEDHPDARRTGWLTLSGQAGLYPPSGYCMGPDDYGRKEACASDALGGWCAYRAECAAECARLERRGLRYSPVALQPFGHAEAEAKRRRTHQRLTPADIRAIREAVAGGASNTEAARALGISESHVRRIVLGLVQPEAGGPLQPRPSGRRRRRRRAGATLSASGGG